MLINRNSKLIWDCNRIAYGCEVIEMRREDNMHRRDFIRISIGALTVPLINIPYLAFGSTPTEVQPEQFGARGDGITDDTIAIQKAIDSGCAVLYLKSTYQVSPQKYAGVKGVIGKNSTCINIRSNLKIYGPGKLILKDGVNGTSGAIMANVSEKKISNCSIQIQIDGNKSKTKGAFSGIVFINAENCSVTDKTIINNVSYNGVQFASGSKKCRAIGSKISGSGYIGVQAQRPQKIIVSNCEITNSNDNGIDFESNNATQNGIIRNNKITNCKSGIFLESGGNCEISNNEIQDFNMAGIFLNRINTPANNVSILNNKITNITKKEKFGAIAINNAIKNVVIGGNTIKGVKYGVWINGGIDQLALQRNEFSYIQEALVRITREKNSLVRSKIEQQIYIGKKINGKPFTTSPIGNKNNFSNRIYNVSITPMETTENPHNYKNIQDEYLINGKEKDKKQLKSDNSRYKEWETE